MATVTTDRLPDRHAWLDTFLADPASELDNLLSGHARIEPYESADAPDAARLLFGGLSEEDEARDFLDQALCKWLDSQRASGVPRHERLPLERWIRKVSDAFEIVGLLKLGRCSLEFRQKSDMWISWTSRLVVSAQRDGRYAFLRTLALTQRTVADKESIADPFALEPFWLRICDESGSTYPAHYLTLGLLGLRMLPEREGIPSERLWMAGLGRWADGQAPSISDFSQQWWALKELYPRMPSYWRGAIRDMLRQSSARQIPDELKEWWLQDVKAGGDTTAQPPQGQPVGFPRLPPLSAVESLLERAGNPLSSIGRQIGSLIGERRQYAEVTGESHYLVTTACNIGMAIIQGDEDPVGRGRLAVDLARQALVWQPANVYAWALWRDALAKQGTFDAAELVGWEAIRRFPENVQWRTQLALLLSGLPGRESEAEQLLRETIERFPDNAIARTQLAELLIALERMDEATAVVEDIFSCHQEEEVGFDLRARLLYHSGEIEAARDILRSGAHQFPTNPILQAHLQMLDDGRPLPLKATAYRTDAVVPETSAVRFADTEVTVDTAVSLRGRVRRLFSEYRLRQNDNQWRGTALEEVRRVLTEDPNLAYANYMKQELEGRDGDGSVGEAFAIAFIDAVKRKDADRFAELDKSISSQARLIDVAKSVIFGDPAATNRMIAWLSQEARSEPRTVSALRGFLRQRFDITTIPSGEAFVKLLADNDNIQTDLIEAALAGDELLFAA